MITTQNKTKNIEMDRENLLQHRKS